MHAVEIFAFVEACDIPASCFDTPYYLAPAPGGEKIYALLRETLDRTRKIGIAQVVIQARPLLAALIPCGSVLMLNTLRLRGTRSANGAPGRLKTARPEPTESELAMAAEVVESMTRKWHVAQHAEAVEKQAAPVRWNDASVHESWLEEALSDDEGIGGSLADLLRPEIRFPEQRQPADTSGYQAQRNSRPRGRWRGTMH
jgi:DNA end-binding protein Ku